MSERDESGGHYGRYICVLSTSYKGQWHLLALEIVVSSVTRTAPQQ